MFLFFWNVNICHNANHLSGLIWTRLISQKLNFKYKLHVAIYFTPFSFSMV